jgi:hypothetical protein
MIVGAVIIGSSFFRLHQQGTEVAAVEVNASLQKQ